MKLCITTVAVGDVRRDRSRDGGIRDGGDGAGGAAPPVANRPLCGRADAEDRCAQSSLLSAVSAVERRRGQAALDAVAGRLADRRRRSWRSGSCRSARSSGRSSPSTAVRWKRASCGDGARISGCLRRMRGTRRRPRRRWRLKPASPTSPKCADGKRHSIPSIDRMPLVPRLEPHRDPRLRRAAAVRRSRSERAARRAADARDDHAAHVGRRKPDHAAAAPELVTTPPRIAATSPQTRDRARLSCRPTAAAATIARARSRRWD